MTGSVLHCSVAKIVDRVHGTLNVGTLFGQVVSLHLNTMTTLQLFRGDTVQIKV
jgi:hypothetical protein